jgi:hypothetical protein
MTEQPHLYNLTQSHGEVLAALLGPLWPIRTYQIAHYGPLTKYTLGQAPDGDWVHLHHVTHPDTGAPHCHPCRMLSTRIKGSYWERLFRNGQAQDVLREEGSSHVIEPDCVHLLTALPDGEVWTLVKTGPVVRDWQHYPELVAAA